MDHRLICEWLELPSESWPPDPLQLVGLGREQLTQQLLDERVHERMEIVRRYQLAHPDESTEAMNRLAQAYLALLPVVSAPTGEPPVILEAETARTELGKEGSRTSSDPSVRAAVFPVAIPSVPAPAVPQEIQHAAPAVVAATRRALYHRIARIRRVLRVWEALGDCLRDSTGRVTRSPDAALFAQHCAALAALARSLPSRLGSAGQTGYLVVALARQQVVVSTFQSLLSGQREALARDWIAGQAQLQHELATLRAAARTSRKKASLRRSIGRPVAFLAGRPGIVLFALGCLALLVALWRTLAR